MFFSPPHPIFKKGAGELLFDFLTKILFLEGLFGKDDGDKLKFSHHLLAPTLFVWSFWGEIQKAFFS